MVIVRSGLDRMMFTIVECDYKKFRYDKDVELKYNDRLRRLKFSDRTAWCIHFEKYPHRTWKYNNEVRSTYAVEMDQRIDGMRQLRVWINGMRLFNIKNGLDPSPKALWDDNFVSPDVVFTMPTFVSLVKDELQELRENYIQIRKEVFGDDISIHDICTYTHSIEAVREGLGLHTSDVAQVFQDFPLCDNVKVYHNQTNTTYFNTSSHRQIKFYNKGIGVLRMEATFNFRPGDIVSNWQDSPEEIAQSVEMEIDNLLFDMKIPNDWYDSFHVTHDNLIWLFANGVGLRDENNEVEVGLMKILLTAKSFSSTRNNRPLIRRLSKKELIKPSYRGTYVPTERLLHIRHLYNLVKRTQGRTIVS